MKSKWEPVSEELEEAASRYSKEEYSRKNQATLPDRCRGCYAPLMYAFKAGAQWQKQQIVKEIKIRLADAATNQDSSTDIVEQTYYNGMVDALGRLRDKFMED